MINSHDLLNAFWLTGFLLALSTFVFVFSFLAASIAFSASFSSLKQRAMLRAGLFAAYPISFTGVISGFLTASSRAPAVAALLPAVMTFVGLLLVYMIGKGRIRAVVAGFAAFVFSLSLMIGVVTGGASRDRYDELTQSAAVRKRAADQELELRLYCVSLGMISDVTKPCPVGETDNKDGDQTSAK